MLSMGLEGNGKKSDLGIWRIDNTMSSKMHIDHIFAVKSAGELANYQAFVQRIEEKLYRYIAVLQKKYAVEEWPSTIIWTSHETATKRLNNIPVPAYTNERRIVFCPELRVWREIYLAQLKGLTGETAAKIRKYYETCLNENHVLQILGHEFAHHSEYFSDEDYEIDPWYEEGMAEYISRKELLSEAEFEEKAEIERLLVDLLSPRFSKGNLAPGSGEDYAGIFFSYWRGFLAAQKRVAVYGGNVVDALKCGRK